jgi:hypothetical protein
MNSFRAAFAWGPAARRSVPPSVVATRVARSDVLLTPAS